MIINKKQKDIILDIQSKFSLMRIAKTFNSRLIRYTEERFNDLLEELKIMKEDGNNNLFKGDKDVKNN